MAKNPTLQPYPRMSETLLSSSFLFPIFTPPMSENLLSQAIERAFERSLKNKQGKKREILMTPTELVDRCIQHLRERSDPILGPYFVSKCNINDLFAFDAISHEMQRNRMTIGIFYQFLILELMRQRWQVFDGSREGDIVADISTPTFKIGMRLYMSIKKSSDTVGGQDVGGVINRLEKLAKEEKNLNRPYLCVIGVATPSKGKIKEFDKDRQIKYNIHSMPYSLNCEYWGPGFIFPYVTGRDPFDIYLMAIKQVADYIPFLSLEYRNECTEILRSKINTLGLLRDDKTIDPEKFLRFQLGRKISRI